MVIHDLHILMVRFSMFSNLFQSFKNLIFRGLYTKPWTSLLLHWGIDIDFNIIDFLVSHLDLFKIILIYNYWMKWKNLTVYITTL